MMDREEADRIFAAVKANHAKLRSCAGPHAFEPCQFLAGRVPRRYRCTKCGGEADSVDVSWYHRGLEHGKRS